MASRFPTKRAVSSSREILAGNEGRTRPTRAPSHRLDAQKAGRHRVLAREGWDDYVFAFHEGEEIGPRMLARIAKHTGLRPEDLQEDFFSRGSGSLTAPAALSERGYRVTAKTCCRSRPARS